MKIPIKTEFLSQKRTSDFDLPATITTLSGRKGRQGFFFNNQSNIK